MTQKAIIIGAGVGGFTAALALQKIGWEVHIFEQAAQISEIGAGLQISPNGVAVLEHLSVMPQIEGAAFEPVGIEARIGTTGRRFFHMPLKGTAQKRWGAKYIQIHRADLVGALLARFTAAAPHALHLAQTAAGYERQEQGVKVHFKDHPAQTADLLIGADGIHSAIRKQMIGPDAPRFTGNLAWRCTVPLTALKTPPPPTGCIWAGAGKHAVTTRIKGGDMVNFVGIKESQTPMEEGWKIKGDAAKAQADFAGWHPVIADILQNAGAMHKWALFDRSPLPKWSDGPVALLGDAAHPMLPSMAQGAVQAIEDAYFLAQSLQNAPDIAAGCSAYFKTRNKRTNRVQRVSAQNLRLFHKRSKLAQVAHYAPIWATSTLAPTAIYRRYDWLYGHLKNQP